MSVTTVKFDLSLIHSLSEGRRIYVTLVAKSNGQLRTIIKKTVHPGIRDLAEKILIERGASLTNNDDEDDGA